MRLLADAKWWMTPMEITASKQFSLRGRFWLSQVRTLWPLLAAISPNFIQLSDPRVKDWSPTKSKYLPVPQPVRKQLFRKYIKNYCYLCMIFLLGPTFLQNYLLTLKLPDKICNFPYCQPYNFYNVGSENLVLDQQIILKLKLFYIRITYLVDIVLIL